MKNDDISHHGHRERLLKLAHEVGLEKFDKINALEVMLFMVFPRGDVNPLAHRLLDKYGDIPSIIQAPIEDLKRVKGMGKISSLKIKLFQAIANRINIDKSAEKKVINTLQEACNFVECLLRFKDTEEVHVIALGNNNEVLDFTKIADGNLDSVNLNKIDLTYFILRSKAKKVIVVHNHPNGYCQPSTQDIISNDYLNKHFYFIGIEYIDHLIVGVDGIYSINQKSIIKIFERKKREDSLTEDVDVELMLREGIDINLLKK